MGWLSCFSSPARRSGFGIKTRRARQARDALAALGKIEVFACDQTRYDEVEKATDATQARFGRVDIMINNSGISGPNVKLVDYPIDDWVRVISVDLIGVFHCCRTLVPHLVRNKWGRIVNIA